MLDDVVLHGRKDRAFAQLLDRCDRTTFHRLSQNGSDPETLRQVLSTAQFSPGLPLRILGLRLAGSKAEDLVAATDVPFPARARALAAEHFGCAPDASELVISLHLSSTPYFLAQIEIVFAPVAAGDAPPLPSPVGQAPRTIVRWFDTTLGTLVPERDGSLETARDAASAYALNAKAPNTRKAYRAGVRAWCAWAEKHALPCLPARAADVAAFLADERGRGMTPGTLELRRASLTYLHRLAGCPVPTADAAVGETMAGIRKTAAREGFTPRRKAPATLDILRQIIASVDITTLAGLRDRALLLMGFYGAFRRSELASLDVRHVSLTGKGLLITLPHSKGDRADHGVDVALPHTHNELCPVKAYAAWMTISEISAGAVFRRVRKEKGQRPSPALSPLGSEALTDRSIARIIQARAAAIGLDGSSFGGHSLKRGALTTGMQAGAHPVKLKRLARHSSYAALGDYLELGDPFDEHALIPPASGK
ncbi:site-specific integrase [Acetobacter sp. TBRC 12305]|uniref:Site-specific integrase n=1 Tax=Acetobacter garciniae TaxID=2817435 RepID=A0A939HQ38_9PROT|nr:site-specific integrase [Acetobacter garciniae]MBO1326189.1 site-specific integrase [Acetobacter garciniae]MBX0346074.1 site-specific integrase [Acetobacter garciniae]